MKRYKIRDEILDTDREELREYSDLVSKLLYHRGIQSSEAAKHYFNPSYEDHTHDPFLLKNMEKVVERILKAIKENDKVTIYSDYDADGIPGAVVLSDFFEKIGFNNFDVYIPHRNKEGFGLNKEAIEKICEEGTKLLITIDCGIADVDEVDLASVLGLEVIITDHHEPNGKNPKAFGIINPKIDGCQYPEKMLCGSGVVFKLVQALIQKGNFDLPNGWEKWLLDMVGIATLSDMVPLTGENRVFAHYGLIVLRKSPRVGILRLLKKARIRQSTLNDVDVGFTISPRINAASRMGEPKLAFQMLRSKDEVEAEGLVKELDKINNERKGIVAAMVKEAKKHVEKSNPPHAISCGNPSWKPSLLGLAANSIAGEYGKPTFLWGRGEGKDLKGSCRGNGEVNVLDLMSKVGGGILETFGGHKEAGGFVINLDKVDLFEDRLNEVSIEGDSESYIEIDSKIDIDDVDENFLNTIDKLSPFGVGNRRPMFLIENILPERIDFFGKSKEHMKLVFRKKYGNINAIAFFKGMDSWTSPIKENERVSLVVEIERSQFNGTSELRLKIIDVI
ncbi:MAG: single-stranded-DNA-specific exonuclease [Candidatus Paceibacteria bacterium]|jgi:single-stranded-DNA-specific exonuclease